MKTFRSLFLVLALSLSAVDATRAAEATSGVLTERPDAIIDLATPGGVRSVAGQWRYADSKIVSIDSKGPGPDLKPSGAPVRTYDLTPHAGAADFDDSSWTPLDPPNLEARAPRAGFASTGIA